MKNALIKIAVWLLKAFLSVIYFFQKLFIKQKDKVVFLSRQSDTPNINFVMIADEIKRLSPQTEIYFSCRLGKKSDMNLSYAFLLLRQMAAITSARTVIVDTYCIPVSLLRHRKNLVVIQIWHALTAVKKFGWQTVGLPEGSSRALSEAMHMHRGYTYVIVGAESAVPIFAEALNVSPDIILPIGLPRSDIIIHGDREKARDELYKKYPQAKGKKIVVYVPTMRRGQPVDCKKLIDAVDYDKCSLMIKLHPLDCDTVIDDPRPITDTYFTTDTAILFADVIVTDYSAVSSDAALLDTPVYFYLPDLEEYKQRCGLNLDPTVYFPEVSFTDANACAEAFSRDADSETVARMREILAGGCDGNGTNHVARLALGAKPEELDIKKKER